MSFEINNVIKSFDEKSAEQYGLGVSLYTDYIPSYVVYTQYERVGIELTQVLTYPKLSLDYATARGVYSRYSDLFRQLNGGRSANTISYTFKYNEQDHRIIIAPGIILDEYGNILLLLTVRKDYFPTYFNWYMNRAVGENEFDIDHSKLKLFVSKEFFSDAKYSMVWKKIEKEYYYGAIGKDVIIEVKPSIQIQHEIFNDGINVNYPTLNGLHQYLNVDIWDRMVQDEYEKEIEREAGIAMPSFVNSIIHREAIDRMFDDPVTPDRPFEVSDLDTITITPSGTTNLIYDDSGSFDITSDVYRTSDGATFTSRGSIGVEQVQEVTLSDEPDSVSGGEIPMGSGIIEQIENSPVMDYGSPSSNFDRDLAAGLAILGTAQEATIGDSDMEITIDDSADSMVIGNTSDIEIELPEPADQETTDADIENFLDTLDTAYGENQGEGNDPS